MKGMSHWFSWATVASLIAVCSALAPSTAEALFIDFEASAMFLTEITIDGTMSLPGISVADLDGLTDGTPNFIPGTVDFTVAGSGSPNVDGTFSYSETTSTVFSSDNGKTLSFTVDDDVIVGFVNIAFASIAGWRSCIGLPATCDRVSIFAEMPPIGSDISWATETPAQISLVFRDDSVAVPEPSTILLMSVGLLGLASLNRKLLGD